MISSISYNGDGSTRIFPVTFKINGEDYVRVYVDNVEVVDRTKYDIINNSIVFTSDDIPAVGTDNIKIYVATSSAELGDLGAPLTDITNVSNNLTDIVAVSTQVIPKLPEILLADNNATIATTKASEASVSASNALVSETNADVSADIAVVQAGIATTKAGEASASATSASNSATSASNSANTATTKANEASASASLASASANNASTSETMAYKWSSNPVDTIVETDKYSAFHWATKAQQYASSVDPSNLVHNTGDETIAGVKTFSSSPIVPIPTTGTQAVNKDYVDSSISSTPTINGRAIFNGATQNINLTNIGLITLAIGDVIEVTGTTSNNKLFTVESITNYNNIVVNYEHRGTSTPVPKGRLINETASNCTIKIYNRAKNAPLGQGQYICVPASGRVAGINYENNTNRTIEIIIDTPVNTDRVVIDEIPTLYPYSGMSLPVSPSSTYRANATAVDFWQEIR